MTLENCKNCKYYKKEYCYLCKEVRDVNVAFECDDYTSFSEEQNKGVKDVK